MIDRYTRIVLTVIALALVALVGQNLLGPERVTAQGAPCGDAGRPCQVFVVGGPPSAWTGLPMMILESNRLMPSRQQ